MKRITILITTVLWVIGLGTGCRREAPPPPSTRAASSAPPVQRAPERPVPDRAPGVIVAGSFDYAMQLAKRENRDLAILVRGSDWNLQGEDFFRETWEPKSFRQSLGDGFVMLDLDVMERPDENRKAELARRAKGFKTQFPSYPALVHVDAAGHRCAVFTGEDFPATTPEAVDQLQAARRARELRDHWFARAESAEGADRIPHLLRAWETGACDKKALLARIRKADPDGLTGAANYLAFDGRSLNRKARDFANNKQFTEGLAWLDEQRAQPGLTPAQQQWILTARGNLYRFWPEHETQAMDAFTEARDVDPDSTMGRAADRLARRFVGPPSIDFGWDRRHVSTTGTVWRLEAPLPIDQPGTYEVTLDHRRGRSGLTISRVALLDGRTLLAEDIHPGFTGNQDKQNCYRLTVSQVPRRPVLEIACQTAPNTDSQGDIRVERATTREGNNS